MILVRLRCAFVWEPLLYNNSKHIFFSSLILQSLASRTEFMKT